MTSPQRQRAAREGTPPVTGRSGLRRFAASWGAVAVAAIALDLAIVATYFHLPARVADALKLSFPVQFKNWLLWAALAPVIIVFARTMVSRRWSWAKRIALAMALAVALALTHAAMEMISMGLHTASGGHTRAEPGPFFSYHLWHGLLTFSVLFTVAVMIESERAARARELREAQLNEEVSRAQLQMLRMQLQPHFLFNTLNSISALVEDDARAGQTMIGRLSDLLRLTLSAAGHTDVPLADELALLRQYLELERTRFAERLRFTIDVEAGAESALVPNLFLQPIVENAVRHGIQPVLGGGTVSVRARRETDWLVVEVEDDGVGLPVAFDVASATGIGLANTRERLRRRFGDRHAFDISPRAPSGTRVTIRMPWSTATANGADGERATTALAVTGRGA